MVDTPPPIIGIKPVSKVNILFCFMNHWWWVCWQNATDRIESKIKLINQNSWMQLYMLLFRPFIQVLKLIFSPLLFTYFIYYQIGIYLGSLIISINIRRQPIMCCFCIDGGGGVLSYHCHLFRSYYNILIEQSIKPCMYVMYEYVLNGSTCLIIIRYQKNYIHKGKA